MSEPKLNPWVTEPAPEESAPAPQEVVYESLPPTTGPTTPQRGVAAPARSAQLPIQDWAASAPLWWVGAHGGAGETTLARLEPSWTAAEHAWPRTPGISKERVVLVARTHLAGLTAAQSVAQQWASASYLVIDLHRLGADSPMHLVDYLEHCASSRTSSVAAYPASGTCPGTTLGASLTLQQILPRRVRRNDFSRTFTQLPKAAHRRAPERNPTMHGLTAFLTSTVAMLTVIPNPDPTQPPGSEGILAILGWAKWVALAVCVAGLIIAGALLAINSRRGEGGEIAGRVVAALIGVIIISAAAALVGFLTT